MIALWVERLLALQAIDLEIRNMRLRLTLIPKEKESLSKQLAEAEAGIKAAQDAVRKCELAIKSAESSIAQEEAHIQKLQQQSALVKKNTEYQAMLTEAEKRRNAISDFESAILLNMDELETAQRQLKEVMRENEAVIANCRTDIAELTEVSKELAEEISRKTAEREGHRKNINDTVLARYEQMVRRGTGIPLSAIKDGICGNCRLRLTPQTMSDAKRGQVTYCDHCMHLIYLDTPEPEA